MNRSAHVIGITGGIGAGKTYVSKILTEHFGIPVYNCDIEAKRLTCQDNSIRQALTALVGDNVYDEQGNLQRSVLARYLFASSSNASKVNSIIHPAVRHDFEEWKKRILQQGTSDNKKAVMALESAILFESGFDNLADTIICVTAPMELRIKRACLRDGASPEDIRRRINQQLSDEERQQRSHYTVINDGQQLVPQIETLLKQTAYTTEKN